MTASELALELTQLAAKAADERSAFDLVALDVSANMPFADVFLLASGRNERMVLSIAEEIEDQLREEKDLKAKRREGTDNGRWVLIDFGDLVVHVFHEEDRVYYGLERIWADAPVVELDVLTQAPAEDASAEDAPAED
ncbi:ribosome silencing factor [Gulosibacter molinativorax]|uniref:Ribosomal silencing factor RsfS n=1 Tax=Gulosibacter molinativorax TaxID=256821 RepID=A0ABT7CAI6_9MICO|nr:ribosome silencing factor [Gulosibacter molinativorax]MDJ1372154.1 ribosome silencing factor [Gulosibacter molinativorax]QUY60975.1 Ribosomal silencing factor RsfS [Gulosibacter molinativorax]